AEFSGEQAYDRQPNPLSEAEGLKELLLGMTEGKRNGIYRRDCHGSPRDEPFTSKVLRTAARSKSNTMLADCKHWCAAGLLIAQCLHRIKLRGPQPRNQPADDADEKKRCRRKQNGDEGNLQVDVALSGVVFK